MSLKIQQKQQQSSLLKNRQSNIAGGGVGRGDRECFPDSGEHLENTLFIQATLLPKWEGIAHSMGWESGFKSQFIESLQKVVRWLYALVVLYGKWKNVLPLIIVNHQTKMFCTSWGDQRQTCLVFIP